MLFCLLSPCHLLSPLLFFFKLPATTEIYTLSLHDALPIYPFVAEIRIFTFNFAPKGWAWCDGQLLPLSQKDRKSTRLNSSHRCISYAVFCLKKKKKKTEHFPGSVSATGELLARCPANAHAI